MALALRRAARLTGVALALVATMVAPACGDGGGVRPDGRPDGPVSQADANEAVAALCGLRSTADPDAAARAFEDQAHDTIHEIADAVRDLDPALAGAVLETKSPIETAVAADEPPSSYRDDVDSLIEAIGAALGALGLTAPTCGA